MMPLKFDKLIKIPLFFIDLLKGRKRDKQGTDEQRPDGQTDTDTDADTLTKGLIKPDFMAKMAGIIGIARDKFALFLIVFTKEIRKLTFVIKKERAIRVFSNPWVIVNGVILIVALCMTAIIVTWFKAKTERIETALTAMGNIQQPDEKGKITPISRLEGLKKVSQPVIVKEEDLKAMAKIVAEIDKYRIEKDGERLKEWSRLADQFYNAGEYEKALAFYKGLIDSNTKLIERGMAESRIGECYYKLGLYEDAIKTLKAVVDNPDNGDYTWQSRYLIGECYAGMGDFDKARMALYELIALEKKFPSNKIDLVEQSRFRIADLYLAEAQRAILARSAR